MPTASNGYFALDGTKLPSVTTICSRFKDSGALISWAYKQGREHEGLFAMGKEAPRNLYDVVGRAAAIGTVVHAMAEDRVLGKDPYGKMVSMIPPDDSDFEKKCRASYGAFESWLTTTRVEFVYTEYPVLSEVHRFGGTLDWIGRINDQLILGDFKTSNAVYSDHLLQVAAYREAWNETHPLEQLAPGAHILQFNKDHGDFAHHYFAELGSAWEMFKHLRCAYEFDKELKKRAA